MPKVSEKTARLIEDKEKIERLITKGKSMREIGAMYGCSSTLVLYTIRPDIRKNRQKQANDRKNRELSGLKPRTWSKPDPKVVVLGEPEPPDTRDLTGRMFGDPIFERSALGRMKQREGA
jgi:hypothetical protein